MNKIEQQKINNSFSELNELDKLQLEVNNALLEISDNDVKELRNISKFENKDVESVVKDYKLSLYKQIVDVYDKRNEKDNTIKEKYAIWLIRMLGIQLIVLNCIFIFQGFGWINLPTSTLNIFITASIAEIFALVNIIVKYLFTDNLTNLLTKILSDKDENEKK